MKTIVIILSFVSIGMLSSCSETGQADNTEASAVIAKDVNVDEFRSLISEKNGTILDVRTPEECAGGIIEGAINIDYLSGDFEGNIKNLDKTKPVYVYCASGGRSASAMNDLSKVGFKEVYNLLGGYNAWR